VKEDPKALKDFIILALALICVGISLVLQPFAELGFTGKFPGWLQWAMGPLGISKIFSDLGQAEVSKSMQAFLVSQGAGKNFGDYAYALFLFAALCVAAVAIILIGREDAEEKTVLPVKK
jgi:hypothetical protein